MRIFIFVLNMVVYQKMKARACLYCAEKEDGEKVGKINVKNKIVSKSIPFSVFIEESYLKHLKLYKKHRFLFILPKDREGISSQEVSGCWLEILQKDLSLQFQCQSQHMDILVLVLHFPLKVVGNRWIFIHSSQMASNKTPLLCLAG